MGKGNKLINKEKMEDKITALACSNANRADISRS